MGGSRLRTAGLGLSMSQLSCGARSAAPPSRPLSKLHCGTAGAAAPPLPSPASAALPGQGGGRCGGAARLRRRARPSYHPEVAVGRKRGYWGRGEGRGGPHGSAAELYTAGGRGGGSFPAFGVWGLGDVRREQGGVTIQQRSGRTTEPSGGGGRGRGHRGEPPPPSAKAYNRGCRESCNSVSGRGKRRVKSAPSSHPTSEGWAIEERLGLERQRGGPSLALPPTGLGRARSVTLSLCRRSSAVSCAVAPVAAAPVAALADAGAMAATDIARQVVSAGLGCQRRCRGPRKGRGDLAAATSTARRAVGSIQEPRRGGTSAPGNSGSVPLPPVPENSGGGGRVTWSRLRAGGRTCIAQELQSAPPPLLLQPGRWGVAE